MPESTSYVSGLATSEAAFFAGFLENHLAYVSSKMRPMKVQ